MQKPVTTFFDAEIMFSQKLKDTYKQVAEKNSYSRDSEIATRKSSFTRSDSNGYIIPINNRCNNCET